MESNDYNLKSVLKISWQYLLLTIGCLLCAASLELILAPNELVDGGVTAMAIMGAELTGHPIWMYFLILNIPMLLASWKALGTQFVVRTSYCNIIVVLALYFLRPMPAVTTSEVLIVLYGGLLLGLGVGLVVRNGAAIDGTEMMAIWLNKNFHIPISTFLLTINVFIIGSAAFVFDLEKAMFSIAVFFLVYKMIDLVLEGINKMVSVMIITEDAEAVSNKLITELEARVTLLHGEGGYTKSPRKIIYCIIDRFAYVNLRAMVLKIDPNAILEASLVTEVSGVHHRGIRQIFEERKRLGKTTSNDTPS